MASQALEYERRHPEKDLTPFYDSSVPKLRHPEVQEWGVSLMKERREMQEKKKEGADDHAIPSKA